MRSQPFGKCGTLASTQVAGKARLSPAWGREVRASLDGALLSVALVPTQIAGKVHLTCGQEKRAGSSSLLF